MRPTKYNNEIKFKLIDYYAQGYDLHQCADMVGISIHTLNKWRQVQSGLKESMDSARQIKEQEVAKQGIIKLATGMEQYEETRSYYEKKEHEDGSEQLVKVTVKRKILPPDIGAIKMLNAKHFQGEYIENNDSEVNVNVRITQKDRALSAEERLKILSKDAKLPKTVELTDEDYRLIEELEEREGE